MDQRRTTRQELGISSDDVAAVYTGKFLPEKRIHDLLKAFRSVVGKHKDFKLILVGDGPKSYKQLLSYLISKFEIRNNVSIVKTVHRTELPSFYNSADFAVWPGTFSISIVEAMACGLPIVIAKSEWTSHYLKYKNGYSFKAGDIDKLSSIMLRLASDHRMMREMGMESRRLVENMLSWDIIAKKYVKIYRACSHVRD
jgi:alpha-1,6-mannosyltransferase